MWMMLSSALLLAAASPKDFRALDFNAPCENVAALEAGLGSTPHEQQLPSGFQYAFRTHTPRSG